MLENLKKETFEANMRLAKAGLAPLTWGNASGFDPESGLMAIKPSGVAYDRMRICDIVIVDLSGSVVEGALRPSSDTPTHLEIYRNFKGVRGVVHTHSPEATAWAQARLEIPCYGTTHADVFRGNVPLARILEEREVREDYELATGRAIVECFAKLDPLAVPGVLAAGHGPFTWGASPQAAVDNAIALEQIAKMARLAETLCDGYVQPLPQYIADKHYMRKHGENAYYGQSAGTAHA